MSQWIDILDWTNWIIWSIYFVMFYIGFWVYRNSKDGDLYQYFLKGFIIKVIGGLVFALVFVYYYKAGDTVLYFSGSTALSNLIYEEPVTYFKLLFLPSDLPPEYYEIARQIPYSHTGEEWFMVKLISFFAFLSFKKYLVLSLWLNMVAFWGSWKLYQVFADIMPEHKNKVFLIIFFLPSTFFWGVGILKDTITLAVVFYVIYVLYQILEKKKFTFKYIIGVLLGSFVVYKLKSYLLLALLPSMFTLVYLYVKYKINHKMFRQILGPLLIILFLIPGYFGVLKLSEGTNYKVDKLQKQVEGFHSWHTTTGGSSYNLGEVEYTFWGIISKIPASLNVTFFRPYLWEAKSVTSLIGALESTFVLVFFLFVFFKTRRDFFKYLNSNKFILGLSVFVLFFGFVVGFTSYNFGALARYKMPIYPLFVLILLYIYSRYEKEKIS